MLASCVGSGYCAEPSAAALAETMRLARHSDGFEARMDISVFAPDGQRVTSFKLAVIGQVGKDRQRLLLRGIAPAVARNRFVASERSADGRVRAIAYRDAPSAGTAGFDPDARLFDSGMVLLDMFAPWWNWGKQSRVENDTIAGRGCAGVRSQPDDGASKVRAVVSCVDGDAGLSLRTQLYGRGQVPLRTITVERLMRKASGALAARRMTITEADGTVTEVEVYSGDEHYAVTAETFAALDARREGGK